MLGSKKNPPQKAVPRRKDPEKGLYGGRGAIRAVEDGGMPWSHNGPWQKKADRLVDEAAGLAIFLKFCFN